MKKHKVLVLIILATVLVVGTLAVTTKVKNGESAENTNSYTLPVAANNEVQTLDYSNYQIEKVSDVYNTQLQAEMNQQLTDLKACANATLSAPLLVANPYLTNTNSVYINFKTDKEIKTVSYTVKTADIPDFSENLVNNGTATDFASQIIGLIAGKENTVSLTVTYTDGTTENSSFSYTPKASNST